MTRLSAGRYPASRFSASGSWATFGMPTSPAGTPPRPRWPDAGPRAATSGWPLAVGTAGGSRYPSCRTLTPPDAAIFPWSPLRLGESWRQHMARQDAARSPVHPPSAPRSQDWFESLGPAPKSHSWLRDLPTARAGESWMAPTSGSVPVRSEPPPSPGIVPALRPPLGGPSGPALSLAPLTEGANRAACACAPVVPVRSRKPGGRFRVGQRSGDRKVPVPAIPLQPRAVLLVFRRRWRGKHDVPGLWRIRALAAIAVAMSLPPRTTLQSLCALRPSDVLQLSMPLPAWRWVARWLQHRGIALGSASDEQANWLSYGPLSRGRPRQIGWAIVRTFHRAGIPGWRPQKLLRSHWEDSQRPVPFCRVAFRLRRFLL